MPVNVYAVMPAELGNRMENCAKFKKKNNNDKFCKHLDFNAACSERSEQHECIFFFSMQISHISIKKSFPNNFTVQFWV